MTELLPMLKAEPLSPRLACLAATNLSCAVGLPGPAVSVDRCLAVFGDMVRFARRMLERSMPMFGRDPAAYGYSIDYFRALALTTCLQRDFGVRYDLSARGLPRFFRDPARGFVSGLLAPGAGPRPGTCANMPVLFAAVARALGFPVRLALAKGHFFCRWEGDGGRFNVEATSLGLVTPPDAHYLTFPHPIAAEEVRAGLYLRSLSPEEELAAFVAQRGACFRDNDMPAEAVREYQRALSLAPSHTPYAACVEAIIDEQRRSPTARGGTDRASSFGPGVVFSSGTPAVHPLLRPAVSAAN